MPICSIPVVSQFQLHAHVLHTSSIPLIKHNKCHRFHAVLVDILTAAAIINAIAASLHALAADEAGAQVDYRMSDRCWYQTPLDYTYE